MKTKQFSELLGNNFESLLGTLLLFDKQSEYFRYSGFVTAALYEFDERGTTLAINCKEAWFTLHLKKEELIKMFESCIEVVGKTEEESYTLNFDNL